VYSNVSKVMIDARAGSNLLYLPLDKLMQQAVGATAGTAAGVPVTPVPTDSSMGPTTVDPRSRDNQRSRDREGR